MTLLEEPLYSLEPCAWLIYADWLEDQNQSSTRARNIAKGLEKTGGNLWLHFLSSCNTWLNSARNTLSPPDGEDKMELIWKDYRWSEERGGMSESSERATNPIILERGLHPTLAKKFWDKLAEIGGNL